MRLDHLAIAAETLEDGVAWAEAVFGVPFLPGGKHARFGTHNRLLGLADEIYLEVIAIDPSAEPVGPRWFGLDHFKGPPRLVNWICEPDDFEHWLRHGMEAVAMSRGDLRWDMGAPPDGSLPAGGGFPTILRWHTDTPPGRSLPPSGCALRKLTVRHPDYLALAGELGNAITDSRIDFQWADTPTLDAQFDTPKGRITI